MNNQKKIEKLQVLEHKKEAIIQNILDIRDMDMIEFEDDLDNEQLKNTLMQEPIDTLLDIFDQLIKVLEKELGIKVEK